MLHEKRICFLALLIAISLALALALLACSKNELIDVEGETTEVIISKSEGSETTVTDFTGTLSDKQDLKVFREILSNVTKEEGEVKMMSPKFDLEVIYKENSRQKLYLWLGKDGQQSSLMETNDTLTLYSISGKDTHELINLMK